jgi:ribosomal protein L39E
MALGPCVYFDPDKIALQPKPLLSKRKSLYLLRFDDHVMHLTRDEDVENWLPPYHPTSKARWLAMPRLILPDETLGQRMMLERAAKSSNEVPRWQAVKCVVETRQNTNRITGATQTFYRLVSW